MVHRDPAPVLLNRVPVGLKPRDDNIIIVPLQRGIVESIVISTDVGGG